MLLKDVGNISSLLGDSPLAASRLWNRDVEAIQPIEFLCFIRRMQSQGYEEKAKKSVQIAVNEIFLAVVQGDVQSTSLIRKFSDTRPSDFSKVKVRLAKLTLVRRKAFMFMLECGLNTQEIIKLKWSDVRGKAFTSVAATILRSLPRHISSNFVFWEYGRLAKAMPLIGFAEDANGILEDDWSNYVVYDYAAEMSAFQQTLEQTLNLKVR